MKKVIFFLSLLLAMPGMAQDNKNTIVVYGEAEKTVLDDSYTVLIALQQILVYDGQVEVEATSLDDVREKAIKNFKAIGIDFKRFKRSTYYEFSSAYGQGRESAYYYLKTFDEAEVRKIIKLKSSGMSISNIEVEAKKLSGEQLADLSLQAITNAKEKAELIAKKMDKTIGAVVSVSDLNTNIQYVQSYGTSTFQIHGVTVTFELK